MRTVAAIAVIDLAKELLSEAQNQSVQLSQTIEQKLQQKVAQLSPSIMEGVLSMQQGQDLSHLLDKRYPEQYLIELWQLADQYAKPSFGIDLGMTISVQAKGILSHWISYTETLAEAFATYSKHIALMNPSEQWSISELRSDESTENSEDKIRLEFKFQSDTDYPLMAIERSLLAPVSWGQYLSGNKIEFLEITLANNEYEQQLLEDSAERLRQRLNCDVFIDDKLEDKESSFSITFNRQDFYQKIATRNQYMKDVLKQKSLEIYSGLNQSTQSPRTGAHLSYTDKIQQLFIQDLGQYSFIDNVCQSIGVSRSSLYRHLKKEQTSYTELLKQHRQKLIEAEGQGMNAEQLAELLEFQDVSSIYKFINKVR